MGAPHTTLHRHVMFLHRSPSPPAPARSALEAETSDDFRASRFNQEEILDALPSVLRQEVVLYTNAALLSRLPSLARQQPDVQAFVVEHLRRQTAMTGEYIAVENSAADSMFFLAKGKVRHDNRGGGIGATSQRTAASQFCPLGV